MYEVIYRLLEIAALVVCSYSFSGEKLKLDIYNVGFVTIELTFMQMIQDKIVSKEMYFAIYLIYFIYVYVRFQNTIKRAVLECMLATFIMGGLQILVYIPVLLISPLLGNESFEILLINAIVLIIVIELCSRFLLSKLVDFCENKDWILTVSLLSCVAIIMFFMYSLKNSEIIQVDIFVLICVFTIILVIFLYRWQKSIYELERKKRELEITNLYNGVFEELIDTIRHKQHDFHNHIDAVYSTHLVANTMEELITLQNEYCSKIIYENRFTKILSKIKNSVLAGFIYSKFSNVEKRGIEIKYDVSYGENTDVSVFDLVEIIGIFMDNAVEALEVEDINKLIVFELRDNDGLYLCIRNPVKNITNKDIERFFVNGYTTKQFGNGIGLSKIKKYQEKYDYNIFAKIIDKDMIKWIEFKIMY